MKRKALGKGLSSLIPQPPPATVKGSSVSRAGEGLQQIDLDLIHPNRDQPRKQFDDASLEDLARSMKLQGILQPVVVRPAHDGKFELIAGERRWRAAQIAGLMRVPAIVRTDVDDERLLELALIENLQREDLNPLDSAGAYQTLIDEFGLSQQEVADRVGKQRATVANTLRLLNLPLPVQEMIREGRLLAGHAKALASLASDSAAQIELAKRIVQDDLSVRQVEVLVARAVKAKKGSSGTPKPRRPVDPNVEAAEQSLQRALGTKVRIVPSGKGGRLELHYFSEEELQRIYQIIFGATSSKS